MLEIRKLPVLVLFLLSACGPPAADPPPGESTDDGARQLAQLFADEWADRLARYPLFASGMGVHDYDDRLPDVSPEAHSRFAEADRNYLARLDAVDRTALSAENQINYDLFRFIVGHRATLAAYRQYRIPILSDGGFHMGVPRMYESMPFATVADYERYLARLDAIGSYFEQNIANMRTGIAEGFTQPREILDGIVPSITGVIVDDADDSVFYRPFANMPAHFSAEDTDRLRAAAADVISEVVVPAYREFHRLFRRGIHTGRAHDARRVRARRRPGLLRGPDSFLHDTGRREPGRYP